MWLSPALPSSGLNPGRQMSMVKKAQCTLMCWDKDRQPTLLPGVCTSESRGRACSFASLTLCHGEGTMTDNWVTGSSSVTGTWARKQTFKGNFQRVRATSFIFLATRLGRAVPFYRWGNADSESVNDPTEKNDCKAFFSTWFWLIS